MFLLESLYFPTGKDRLSGLANRRFIERQTATFSNAIVTATFSTVPSDVVRMVTNVSLRVQAGGAQLPQAARMDLLVSGTGIEVVTFGQWSATTAGAPHSVPTVNPALLVFPGEYLFLVVQFDAGANPNSVYCGISGVEVPRANLQR